MGGVGKDGRWRTIGTMHESEVNIQKGVEVKVHVLRTLRRR